jgi:hypothetical protein
MKSEQDLFHFLLQHTLPIARTTAPLLGVFADGPEPFATCVLLKIADIQFVISVTGGSFSSHRLLTASRRSV